jgi:NADH dehydrogenase FAD-containing subunit
VVDAAWLSRSRIGASPDAATLRPADHVADPSQEDTMDADRTSVVVVGGGFAGLESAFLLRQKLGDRVSITLVSDRDRFLFKPNTIYIPFGGSEESLLIPLEGPTSKRGIAFVHRAFESLDREARVVRAGGRELRYDYLVLATGAAMRAEEVPGLDEHAETIWNPREMESLGRRLREVVAAARDGREQRILFLVPPNNKCAGPLYELVMMVDTWLRRQKARDAVHVEWATFEPSYIAAFGPKLHTVVTEEFARRGVTGHTLLRVSRVDEQTVHFETGEQIPYDLLVSFPPYVAAVRYEGLEQDERGFLKTEPGSRRVRGDDRIYAPGDGGDFPVKQAFLAFLQADAVAEDIAARVEGRQPEFAFDPVSMCVMEEFDKATFAQVPLRVTGDPLRPVEVRPDADGAYRVGVSPVWRVGKKLLGLYLPFRFRAGRPFHAGAPWKAMETGLKVMSTTLARR